MALDWMREQPALKDDEPPNLGARASLRLSIRQLYRGARLRPYHLETLKNIEAVWEACISHGSGRIARADTTSTEE